MLKHPELNGSWTFKIKEGSSEFSEYREAANRLIGEGLISETDSRYLLITTEGLRYCARHYKDFPEDMWFKDVTIPDGHLEKLLNNIKQD